MRTSFVPAFLLVSAPWLVFTSRAEAQGQFVERSAAVGLNAEILSGFDRMVGTDVFDWVQSGLAVGDLDGDSDLDVVVAGGVQQNRLFLNELALGKGFVDRSASANIDVGEFDRVPALGDFDNDGDLDLFLGALGPGSSHAVPGASRLYRNEGDGVFEQVTGLSRTVGRGYSLYANWYDSDLDGWLDLYVSEFHGKRNSWYRNDGGGNFSERSAAAGINHPGSTHVSVFLDSDLDGRPDLFVGNDYPVQSAAQLPGNVGDAHFHGVANGVWQDVSDGSNYDVKRGIMGISVGDVNYDGLPDIYKTDAGHNFLMVNQGWPSSGLPWVEEQDAYGVANEEFVNPNDPDDFGRAVGWTGAFMNADLDPWRDLFVVNGHVPSKHPDISFAPANQQNFMFLCDGPSESFHFTDATEELGLLDYFDDRGGVIGDMDLDGDLDLFVTPTSGQVRYFENQLDRNGQGWLSVEAVCQTSAPGGAGVQVRWTDSSGLVHLRMLGSEAPTASQHEGEAFFGLGHEATADVSVQFPSGIELTFDDVPANTRLQAVEPQLFEISNHVLSAADAGSQGSGSAPSARLARGEITAVSSGPMAAGELKEFTKPQLEVRVFAHASDGTPLDETAVVGIQISGVDPKGLVEHVAGNEFRRVFEVPSAVGEYRVRATMNGFAPAILPRVFVRGEVSAAETSCLVTPSFVRANSQDTYTVEVVPRDANGLVAGPGLEVLLRRVGEPQVYPMESLGDGRYAATLTAPATTGERVHDVQVFGTSAALSASVFSAGPVSVAETSLYEEIPPIAQSGLNMGAPHQMRVLITPRDAAGYSLGRNVQLQVQVVPDAGSDDVVWRSDLFPGGQLDGDYVIVFEKPTDSPQGGAFGTYRVIAQGTVLATRTFEF